MRGRTRTVNKTLPPHLHKKGATYYYVALVLGKRKWTRLSDNYGEALAKWAALEGHHATGSTVGDALTRYLREIVPTKAPKTQEEYTRQIGKLRAVFGDMKLDNVRGMDIAQYLDQSAAKVAANREIAVLSSVFKYAIRWGWTERNPTREVGRNTERERTRYLEDAELVQLREAADDQLKAVIDLAYLTGMRKGDLLTLRLADLTDAGIRVTQGKTGKAQLFQWSPALTEVVERAKKLKRRATSLYVFASRDGTPYSVSGFNSIWRRLKERAGLGDADVHFHDIRAKSLTDAKEKGGIDYAKLLAGHASVVMTERYIRARSVQKVQPLR
jgi:integrase